MFSPELENFRPKAGKHLLEVIKVFPQRYTSFSKNLTKLSELNKAKPRSWKSFPNMRVKFSPKN